MFEIVCYSDYCHCCTLSSLALIGKLGSIGHYQMPKGYEFMGKSGEEHRCIYPGEENNSVNRNYE